MPEAKQLSVSVENRPGTLAHVGRVLGDAKVNIVSFLCTTSGTEGSVELVVDNVTKAKKVLGSAGLTYTEREVLHVELANVPGAALCREPGHEGDQHYVGVPDSRQGLQEGERSARCF